VLNRVGVFARLFTRQIQSDDLAFIRRSGSVLEGDSKNANRARRARCPHYSIDKSTRSKGFVIESSSESFTVPISEQIRYSLRAAFLRSLPANSRRTSERSPRDRFCLLTLLVRREPAVAQSRRASPRKRIRRRLRGIAIRRVAVSFFSDPRFYHSPSEHFFA